MIIDSAWERTAVLTIAVVIAAAGCTKDRPESGVTPAIERPARSPDARPRPSAFVRKACALPQKWIEYVYRGWDGGPARAYDLALFPKPPNYLGSVTDTSHSGPYGFLQRIPLVFYGPGFIRDTGPIKIPAEVTAADIAPTVARLLDFGFPDRDGRAIEEILRPSGEAPKLIVTAIVDGGGWNVLELWRNRWPHMKRLMRHGASIDNAVVGSSPSITPAIHTSISTGAFPNRHKITAIQLRTDQGKLTEAFVPHDTFPAIENIDPGANTNMPAVADLWDRSVDNRALVGMISPGLLQLGMMGLATSFEGGDKDYAAVLAKEGDWTTNPDLYSMPGYVNDVEGPEAELEAVDRSDGQVDGLWRGHTMPEVDATPAFAPWENRTMQAILKREGFGRDDVTDLFYVNYKSPDKAGHTYNMIAPEQGEVIESVDTAIGEMISWLDENVGRSEYVFVLTADHGQTPLEAGGWSIRPIELTADINHRFDHNPNGKGLVQETSASIFFMNKAEMKANGVTPEAVSRFLLDYTFADNVSADDIYPAEFTGRENEKIFRGVVPGGLVDDVHEACV
jgi:hypothetical protein